MGSISVPLTAIVASRRRHGALVTGAMTASNATGLCVPAAAHAAEVMMERRASIGPPARCRMGEHVIAASERGSPPS